MSIFFTSLGIRRLHFIRTNVDNAVLRRHETCLRNIVTQERSSADETPAAYLDAGVYADTYADATVVADDGAELRETRSDFFTLHIRLNFSFIQAEVPRRCTRSKRHIVADNAVADVGHVCPNVVTHDRAFHFRSKADDTFLANGRSTNECSGTDHRSGIDSARADDGRVRQDFHMLADPNGSFDHGRFVDRRTLRNHRFCDLSQEYRQETQEVPWVLYGLPEAVIRNHALHVFLHQRRERHFIAVIFFRRRFLHGIQENRCVIVQVCDDVHEVARLIAHSGLFLHRKHTARLGHQVPARKIFFHFLRENRSLHLRALRRIAQFSKRFRFDDVVPADNQHGFFFKTRQRREQRRLHATLRIFLLDDL